MKYIRTKDGRILKIYCENVSLMEKDDGCSYYGKNTIDFETSLFLSKSEILNQAETIEELIDLGDLVGVMWYDDYDEPFDERYITIREVSAIGVDSLAIEIDTDDEDYSDYSSHIVELYLKQPNGDYKLVAKKKTEEGKLELL